MKEQQAAFWEWAILLAGSLVLIWSVIDVWKRFK